MFEEKKPAIQVAKKNPGHRFQEGHPRFGGKKRNTAAAARAMAAEMGVDPLEFMLYIINSDVIEQTVIVDGKKKRVEVAIPLDTRLDAAKTVVNYLYPRLTAQQITGKDEGPVEVAGLDVGALLKDPAMAEAAQKLGLALALAEAEQAQAPVTLCGPGNELKALPARANDVAETLTRLPNGHWRE